MNDFYIEVSSTNVRGDSSVSIIASQLPRKDHYFPEASFSLPVFDSSYLARDILHVLFELSEDEPDAMSGLAMVYEQLSQWMEIIDEETSSD